MSEPALESDAPSEVPVRLLSDREFLALRTALADHGFTEANVCAHLGLSSLFDFQPRAIPRSDEDGAAPTEADGTTTPRSAPEWRALDVLVRLFMESRPIPRAEVEAELGDAICALLERAGLLLAVDGREQTLVGTVLLYPVAGQWLASDRTTKISATVREGGKSAGLPRDAVYPALTDSVRVFLSTLPTAADAHYLELCSGTGVAALIGAAHGAREAVAVDITARSTAFAAFNARLNGLTNVQAYEGDLYAPVAGRRFDIIVAHPPYVVATHTEYIYRDGGEDGEQITRGILEGAADHLAPRGVLHCTCIVSSRAGRSSAQRVRDMLGDSSPALDLLFIRNGDARIIDQLHRELMSAEVSTQREARAKLEHLEALHVESVDYCTIVLRRHGASREGFTRTVTRTGGAAWPQVDWMFAIGEAALDREAFAARLLDSRVRLSPAVQLDVTWRFSGDSRDPWTEHRAMLTTRTPFDTRIELSMADASILARFDGSSTLREHLRALQSDGVVPEDTSPLAFAHSFGHLVLGGFVIAEAYPLP